MRWNWKWLVPPLFVLGPSAGCALFGDYDFSDYRAGAISGEAPPGPRLVDGQLTVLGEPAQATSTVRVISGKLEWAPRTCSGDGKLCVSGGITAREGSSQ